MAGKIIADTLEHSTAGSIATNYVVEGSAKSWVNMDATGTTDPASTTGVRDSFNVASILDIANGGQTVNLSNNMSNANYAMTVNQRNTTTVRAFVNGGNNSHSDPTSSAFDVAAFNETGNAYIDPNWIWAVVHGDLA
jgi:hypothetical protein